MALPENFFYEDNYYNDVDELLLHLEIEEDKHQLAMEWHQRVQPNGDDIIILLGADVHSHFIPTVGNVIKIAHPSSKRSHIEMDDYVLNTVNKINQIIK